MSSSCPCAPTAEKMNELAKGMASAAPPYKIIQKNADAHIVSSEKHKTVGYVIINNKAALPDTGMVIKTSSPCTVMTTAPDAASLELGVADPDRFAEPHDITVTLKGLWKLKKSVVTEGVDAPKISAKNNAEGEDHRRDRPLRRRANGGVCFKPKPTMARIDMKVVQNNVLT